jgi:Winged helix-turn helix
LTPEADSRIGIYLIHHGKQLLGEFAMSTPVPLRSDFDTIGLRMLARRSRDPDQTRRLLALAEIYDGGSRPDAARIGGVGVQIVRDWVVRFNAKGPDGLLTGKAPGAPSILGERQRQALRQVVEDWADSRPAWRRPLAADRSGAVALRRVPGFDLQADAQPRAAAYGLSQALGATAPSCARRGSRGGF